ncbi:hypothetical protein M3J09_000523 [Ascochyta lentis]
MRLLKLLDDGALSLVEFTGSDIPPYATLSHTWGPDYEEVTFNDLDKGTGRNKIGYRKLTFCAKQAEQDGLQFFWVDTCCIDKSSSAELTEAINSMFQWYHKSAQCYVYMSDVALRGNVTWEQSFQRSKWFTRGWTLQELLAPKSLHFFAVEGDILGNRTSLLQAIHNVTGVSHGALQGEPLHHYSMETRFSWAERRETKREEDLAYSLLGIFGIYMPLIYGEGRRSAFARLRKEIDESLKDQTLSASSYFIPADQNEGALNRHYLSISNMEQYTLEKERLNAQQNILDSLRYSRMEERKLQINEAQTGTYGWILDPEFRTIPQSDSLLDWLSSCTESRRIYWIYGKPGSGKSTMMRFLGRNISTLDHMLPWTKNKPLLRIQHFFWNPGSELQKSIHGFLRALLCQLLMQNSDLFSQVVCSNRWAAASAPGAYQIDWTQAELQQSICECIRFLKGSATVFILLDGLDEVSGTDDTQTELAEFLIKIASFQHVKICVSSRPWNIFRDAFKGFPRLRLEDLTRDDISLYINAKLSSHAGFQLLSQYHQASAVLLTRQISQKASGVFLWVRLVVRELLAGLRDGDGIKTLQRKLELIPNDLNDYFRRLMDSIPPQQRHKASVLLQIALYAEKDFVTLHPLRLIDLCFTDVEEPGFILSDSAFLANVDLANRNELKFRLDSTLRRLNSYCMGLLECHYERTSGSVDDSLIPVALSASAADRLSSDHDGANTTQDGFQRKVSRKDDTDAFLQAHKVTVDFFHRTCRDFLLTPETWHMLLGFSTGPYNVQMYLVNARICQFLAMATIKKRAREAMSLASNILSSLARPAFRDTINSAALAAIIKTAVENLPRARNLVSSPRYTNPSIFSWDEEQSSFLTLAIDFDIVSYVRQHLNLEYVRTKGGRPILDYLLRPRFPTADSYNVGNQKPNTELLCMVLNHGAHPNQKYGFSSIWALYLCFLADLLKEHPTCHIEYAVALKLMIQAGAAVVLPRSWLSCETDYAFYSHTSLFEDDTDEDRFSTRWTSAVPIVDEKADLGSESYYAVGDLLEHFRPALGLVVDRLKELISSKGTFHPM